MYLWTERGATHVPTGTPTTDAMEKPENTHAMNFVRYCSIVEIENECPNLRDSHFQGEGGYVYGRIVCRGDVIQINEIQYRQHARILVHRDHTQY